MSTGYVILDGIQIHPTNVDVEEERIGEMRRMADGTLKMYHIAYKLKWTLSWDTIHQDSYDLLVARVKYRTTSPMIYTDENGNSYTVITSPDGKKETLSAEKQGINGKYHYDVELTLIQV